MNRMKKHRGNASRARVAAAVLIGVIMLPGLAVADHTTCTPGQPQPAGCQQYDPDLVAGAQTDFTDTPSAITWRINQSASGHDQPVLGVNYLIPKGWQFAVNTLRPAQKANGDPATSCSDVLAPGVTLVRSENVADGIGVQVIGRLNGGAAIPFNAGRTFGFLNYDAGTGTANLCLYFRTTSTSIAADAREHVIPVVLQKVTAGEMLGSEDISLTFGWKMAFDLTSFYGMPSLFNAQFSATEVAVAWADLGGGNWQINDTTGNNEIIVISKTPKAPIEAEYRALLTTCLDGLKAAVPAPTTTAQAEALAVADICDNGTLFQIARSTFSTIRHPPNATVYDFARVTGPAGSLPQTGADSTPRFGLVRGTRDVTFTWAQPGAGPNETIKGYVLTVARYGDLPGRHIERMVTNAATDETFDTRAPCGADGKAATCSVMLTFPLNTIGAAPLDLDGKYDVTLVTLYEGLNGSGDKRSDGLCDDVAGLGVDCPLSDPAFRISTHPAFDYVKTPGVSTWQFLLREKVWPHAYVEVQDVRRSGIAPNTTQPNHPPFKAPFYVLLVDFTLKQGEFIKWNPLGFEEPFFAPSNTIIGDNATGIGVVSFASATMTGFADNWRFDGYISPVGSAQKTGPIPPCCINAPYGLANVQPAPRARGVFLLYNLKGLPGSTPTGMPQLKLAEPFEGNPAL